MRKFREPTAKNLLRDPMVLGVPLPALISLCFLVLVLEILLSGNKSGTLVTFAIAGIGYVALRVAARFSKTGWNEGFIYWVEELTQKRQKRALPDSAQPVLLPIEVTAPDTFDESDMIRFKMDLCEDINLTRPDFYRTYICRSLEAGAQTFVATQAKEERVSHYEYLRKSIQLNTHVYSLHNLPTTTDPLWLFSQLNSIRGSFEIVLCIRGVDTHRIKSRIEASRRRNSSTGGLSNVDCEITFEEATQVLEGISRGDETVVEISLVIYTEEPADLDPRYFCKENNKTLTLKSALGGRSRFHRSHFVRAVTASDLIPNFLDAHEVGSSILKTVRGKPLYFDPQDGRLEALHWLVVGASGAGKSFFTGLVLTRLIQSGSKMSVLFVDHNRSFRRLVRGFGEGSYLEPSNLNELKEKTTKVLNWFTDVERTISGIELSDLPAIEKKEAIHYLLEQIEAFLRSRKTTHPIYIVLDECWNFMRDEPTLVQRAFREFRKLNGAAVAITQSLSDFLTDESGRSIFQNAPIRILLRQGEDLTPYKGVLGINDVELSKLRLLRQRKGEFSECLIKTPFMSKIGRLHPTYKEHDLLRTDNIRAELIAESQASAC